MIPIIFFLKKSTFGTSLSFHFPKTWFQEKQKPGFQENWIGLQQNKEPIPMYTNKQEYIW